MSLKNDQQFVFRVVMVINRYASCFSRAPVPEMWLKLYALVDQREEWKISADGKRGNWYMGIDKHLIV